MSYKKNNIGKWEEVSSYLLKVKPIFCLARSIRWRSGGENNKKKKKGKRKGKVKIKRNVKKIKKIKYEREERN